MPPNSTVVFYDGRSVMGPKRIPPFYHIKKEIPNFGKEGKFLYVCTDNRGQPVGKPDVSQVAREVAHLTILNKYVIQYNLNYTPNRPAGIERPTPTGKVLPLDALKKIKPNTLK